MTIHPPKHISSIEGLGINTTKTMHRINDRVSVGNEIWNDMKEPWSEGEVIIAKPGYTWTTKWEVGKPYIITKFKNKDGQLIGIYCDISTPVVAIKGGFSFNDLYLDVWQIPGKLPVILDENELEDALSAKLLTYNETLKIRKIADELMISLINDPSLLKF